MSIRTRLLLAVAVAAVPTVADAATPQMQVGFLWHMHQPVYFPGETITQTQNAGHFSYSVYDIHNQRFGPYTSWPKDAISAGAGLPNLGASVSFTGSLIENLKNMQAAGVNGGMWNNWQSSYVQARAMNTVEGNPRLDLIGFNYHHGLSPLLDERDLRMQIKMHKVQLQQTFGSSVPYSTGYFPAETAFSERMVPALVAEGFQWSIVDNIHFDRATKNYPHTNASGLYAPNRADQINPDPATTGGAWIQLNNLWAPSKVSAPDSYRPHNVQYVNPNSGAISNIVAVPGARYEGNEDGRGGYGALQYQTVMDQYKQYNTDPAHPMLVVLHHDGDNYGGGSDSYYHHNFQQMVNWANGNPNYNVTTISDYLEKYPVAASDVIHVESGSWAGADNGDPEFKKWLGDPNGSGWSPDRNSWAVLTAAKNRVFTAEDIAGAANATNVINKTGTAAEKAWHYLVQAEASDHWYWDGTEVWDSNVTRGSNLAVQQANQVLSANPTLDPTPPSVFHPQRDSYNPGGYEFGSTPEPSDFKVWTYAYDVSGLTSVTLKWRADGDGENPLASIQNETYTGGAEVGTWNSIAMTSSDVSPPANVLAATVRALQYGGMITGQSNKLLDYYVEAVDAKGNITRTDIQHVWVGSSTVVTPPPTGGTSFVMDGVLDADAKEVASKNGMKLYVSMHAGKLYVATNDAGEGSDHFIYLAGPSGPGAMVAANWAKAGTIAQWAAFLADENSNDYEAWTNAEGANAAATGPNGGVLEGTIDLAGEFGSIPASVYLAVGLYGNGDGGTLLSTHQLPGTLDSDGNVQANEYLQLTLPQGWAIGGSGDWQTAWNWCEAIPNGVGSHARMLNVIATLSTVTSTTDLTLGHLSFASPYGYTLDGAGAITLDVASGSSTVNVTLGQHVIKNAMTPADNTTFNITPADGSLKIEDLQETSAALTKVGAGTLEVNQLRVGSLDVTDGGVKITGASTNKLGTLNIASGAAVDLRDNELIVTGNTAAQVEDLIGLGRLGTSASTSNLTGLAVAIADDIDATTFGGLSVSGNDVLVMFTYLGDANLSGFVDADDYFQINSNYGKSSVTYFKGDFNYDDIIDADDFFLIDASFAGQNASGASSPASVPEPSSILSLALLGFRFRRIKAVA